MEKSLRPGQIIKRDKKDLIDYAFGRLLPGPSSFADLGGVWDVEALYTFYALEKYEIARAFLIDTDFTESLKLKSRTYPRLTLIQANFGHPLVPARLGRLDAVFLFDVLLHQVDPDWNEILATYAAAADCFLIFNPQFVKAGTTVRLLDLGREEYFQNVPHDPEQAWYKNLFDKMYELNPEHGRIWRDIHNVWQWGITDQDLMGRMDGLGFKLQYYKNCGRFRHLENFENHAFVFYRPVGSEHK